MNVGWARSAIFLQFRVKVLVAFVNWVSEVLLQVLLCYSQRLLRILAVVVDGFPVVRRTTSRTQDVDCLQLLRFDLLLEIEDALLDVAGVLNLLALVREKSLERLCGIYSRADTRDAHSHRGGLALEKLLRLFRLHVVNLVVSVTSVFQLGPYGCSDGERDAYWGFLSAARS